MLDETKLLKELKKSNKELEKYLEKTGIDIDAIKEFSEDEDKFNFALLSTSIIDLRTEISGLKRKLVNDIEIATANTIASKIIEFQENFLKQVSIILDTLKLSIKETKEEVSEEIGKFKKEGFKRIEKNEEETSKLNVEIKDLKQKVERLESKIDKINTSLEKITKYEEIFDKITKTLGSDIKNIEKISHLLYKDLAETDKEVKLLDMKVTTELQELDNTIKETTKKIISKTPRSKEIEEKIIDIEARIKKLNNLK